MKSYKKSRLIIGLALIELSTILISLPLAYFITSHFLSFFNYRWSFNLQQFLFFTLLIIISWLAISRVTSTAILPKPKRYLTLFFQFVRVNFLNLVVLLILKFVLRLDTIPLIFIFFFVPLSMLITFFFRVLSFNKLNIYRTNVQDLRHVIIIADSCSSGIIDKLIGQKEWGYKIDSIISESNSIKNKYGNDFKVLNSCINIKNTLDNQVIDEIIYSKREIDNKEVNYLARVCNEVGVIFRLQSCVSPADPVYLQMQSGTDNKKITLVDTPSNRMPVIIKTMADIYFSITAVIILSPIFLLIALLIKLESKGPVFFKQQRIGLRGRKFKLYKFRTMVADAEQLLEKLKERNEMDGPTFKMKDDPRITKLGKFLRKTGLDEFPQLFNVISGEMSLIGPRPPLESEVRQYKRWQLRRLSVKPGITCTWQIIPNRNDVNFENWMLLDLNYIDNWSLKKDVRLLFETIRSMFNASGR